MEAILYVGHGSRVKAGNEQMKDFVEKAKQAVDCDIQEICFLELAAPDITEGMKRCVERGATSILAVPVLLFSAGHMKVDIPEELVKAMEHFPDVPVRFGKPFGVHEEILNVLEKRLSAAGWKQGDDADFLMVGRGSSDIGALRDFSAMCTHLQNRTKAKRVEKAYLAAALPTFDEGLESISSSEAQAIYVLPYLLFTGMLMKELNEKIAAKSREIDIPIILCDPLGFDKDLVRILCERVEDTKSRPVFTGEVIPYV
ncbi:sirohydrochlorin chelatase [Sinobaca sp. H24]|uniref:sirohydrochlorin chelatase n=1 Tax=Sinobaca sp. H24 TaxID=2923376 RepID=UPI002079B005|nr:sirohydrochlorin chelatase [Sinobaca sp. H24]